ncbi:unnamed protein product [Closterium sp. NIES-54]
MQDIAAAINMIQFYTGVQASIKGRNVYCQFSSHQVLTPNENPGRTHQEVREIWSTEECCSRDGSSNSGDCSYHGEQASRSTTINYGSAVPIPLPPHCSRSFPYLPCTFLRLSASFSAFPPSLPFSLIRSSDLTLSLSLPSSLLLSPLSSPPLPLPVPLSFPQGAPNRIILVTIHNPLYPINVDVLHQVFSPHGFVEKIVTFQKAAGPTSLSLPVPLPLSRSCALCLSPAPSAPSFPSAPSLLLSPRPVHPRGCRSGICNSHSNRLLDPRLRVGVCACARVNGVVVAVLLVLLVLAMVRACVRCSLTELQVHYNNERTRDYVNQLPDQPGKAPGADVTVWRGWECVWRHAWATAGCVPRTDGANGADGADGPDGAAGHAAAWHGRPQRLWGEPFCLLRVLIVQLLLDCAFPAAAAAATAAVAISAGSMSLTGAFLYMQNPGMAAAAAAQMFGGNLPPGVTGTNDRCTLLISNIHHEVRRSCHAWHADMISRVAAATVHTVAVA